MTSLNFNWLQKITAATCAAILKQSRFQTNQSVVKKKVPKAIYAEIFSI